MRGRGEEEGKEIKREERKEARERSRRDLGILFYTQLQNGATTN